MSTIDPDQTLDDIRAAVVAYNRAENYRDFVSAAECIVENWKNLDEWLSSGGFAPEAWPTDIRSKPDRRTTVLSLQITFDNDEIIHPSHWDWPHILEMPFSDISVVGVEDQDG